MSSEGRRWVGGVGWEQLGDHELLLYLFRVGGRVSGWVGGEVYVGCMYVYIFVRECVC